jgi:ribose 5-phosphate isomerase B
MENIAKRKIIIGSDHAGFDMKELLKSSYLNTLDGYEIVDVGCKSKDSVDFPDYAEKLSLEVLKDKENLGIVICGSGIGVSIACNKVAGIRCGLVHDYYTAKMSRLHTDCNVIAIGAQVVGNNVAISIVEAFLGHNLIQEEKYMRRINKITELENKYNEKLNK